MTCQDCYSPECQVETLETAKREALEAIAPEYRQADLDRYDAATSALELEQYHCLQRSKPDGILARIGALEARQDRIEAMLIAKGYEL